MVYIQKLFSLNLNSQISNEFYETGKDKKRGGSPQEWETDGRQSPVGNAGDLILSEKTEELEIKKN